MPIYEYVCPCGWRAERIRKWATRDRPVVCAACGEPMRRIMSLPHCPPDGVYSYAPNVGDANAFERRQQAIRDGVKVIPKTDRLPPTDG